MRARVGRGKLERHSRVMVRRTTGEPAMTVSGGADLCYFWGEEAIGVHCFNVQGQSCWRAGRSASIRDYRQVDNQGLSSSVTGELESTDSSSGPTENSDQTSQKCEE